MKNWFNEWKKDVSEHWAKIALAIIFFLFAAIFNQIAGTFTTENGGVVVPDAILNNIGPYNLSFIFIWLYLFIFAFMIIYPLIKIPKKFHYVLGVLSLFIAVRAGFIVLTHLATPHDAIPVSFPWIFQNLSFNNDLFFSGHTGQPFLAYLIFRSYSKKWAYFMLISSFILGATVLLMHQHYTIDVVSAFFITYGVYKIGNKIFE